MSEKDRVPRLSELVWARGADEPPILHVVIIPGRTHPGEPLDRVVSRALCGVRAVPLRAIARFPPQGSPQAGELCDMCAVGLRAIHRAIRE
jgi:hypothetical protein